MKPIDRGIVLALAAGVWALVAVELIRPASADTALNQMPLQAMFTQYLTVALTQAKSVANGCHIRGEVKGGLLDAQVNC